MPYLSLATLMSYWWWSVREYQNQSHTTPKFSRFDWLEIIDKNRAHFNVARDRRCNIMSEKLEIVGRFCIKGDNER